MNRFSDNIWAFMDIIVGCVVAVIGAHWDSKELVAFGGTVAGYGAAWFRAGHSTDTGAPK